MPKEKQATQKAQWACTAHLSCWPHDLEISFLIHYESMGAKDTSGVANLDPRGMVGRIYAEDH